MSAANLETLMETGAELPCNLVPRLDRSSGRMALDGVALGSLVGTVVG